MRCCRASVTPAHPFDGKKTPFTFKLSDRSILLRPIGASTRNADTSQLVLQITYQLFRPCLVQTFLSAERYVVPIIMQPPLHSYTP